MGEVSKSAKMSEIKEYVTSIKVSTGTTFIGKDKWTEKFEANVWNYFEGLIFYVDMLFCLNPVLFSGFYL